jgi:putative ABC transport system ATP-binding protein
MSAAPVLQSPSPAEEWEGDDENAIAPSKDPNCVISLRGVSKTYLLGVEGVPALRGVTLNIRRGEFIVVLGKSGGGKTSLLNIIGTIDKPTRGDMYICGVRIDNKATDAALADIRLKRLGFVFQTFNLLPGLTALENVELPMILAGWGSSSSRRKRAIRLLSRVGLGERLHHVPGMMSGGEQQRTTIARALANKPQVLLLDEPTGDLDGNNSHIVLKILTDLNRKERVTCIMVTHDVALKNYAHRVLHMVDGKVARIEDIPGFVRESAMEALDVSPAVLAMEELERRRLVELAAERQMLGSTGQNVAVFSGGMGDDDDDEVPGRNETSDVTDATLAAVNRSARSYQHPPAAATSAAASWWGTVSTRVTDWVSGAMGRPTQTQTQTRQSVVGSQGLQTVSITGGRAVNRMSINGGKTGLDLTHVTVDAALGPPSRLPVYANPLSHASPAQALDGRPAASMLVPGTSTGLSGVAAISHALFAASIGGNTEAQTQASGAPTTTVRSPDHYTTYTFSLKAREEERQEREERARAQEAKEAALRATIQAHHEGRLRHGTAQCQGGGDANVTAASAATRDVVETLGAVASLERQPSVHVPMHTTE